MNDVELKIMIGVVGALLLIAQATLIGFKIMEKREARKFFNGDRKNPASNGMIKTPGFAVICIEHAKKLVKIETCLKQIIKTRDEDHREVESWQTEVRDWMKRALDRIDRIKS